jgi:putative ABC transport system permease protein
MRFLSALLYLYPASFRADYGREMKSIVRDRLSETTGFVPRMTLWFETIADVVANSVAFHFDILRQDLRYTGRTLARSPGFALTAILVTGLGVGANTAAFSVADFVLIRPLPYRDADRLVKIWEAPVDGTNGRNEVSPALYQEWTRTTKSFESMGAHYVNAVNLVGTGEPVRLETAFVTGSLLPVLGVSPIRGRLITNGDERDPSAVVLSYSTWQSRFGADESMIGRRISIDGSPRVIVGVMPEDFHYPNRRIALWAPMKLDQLNDEDIGNTYWYVLAKLKQGVSHAQASAEMKGIGDRMRAEHPAELEETGFAVDRLRDEFTGQSRLLLLALCGAAGCVLLIACANLANLLLARALNRRRELVVRSALGAGRERLVRQSITESLVLALLGGVLGVIIAVVSVPLLTRLVPGTLPIAQSPTVDPRIILFAASLTLITGIGFGVLPAWRSAGQVDLGGLRDGTRSIGGRRERARSALVVAEVMASVVLLISAGLLMRALLRIQDRDPGFRVANVLTLRTDLPEPKYDSTARRVAFYNEVLSSVRSIPGVASAAYGTGLPMLMTGGVWRVLRDGEAPTGGPIERASSRFVSPGYFASLSIPLKRGRDFDETDDKDHTGVAVVSESFVKKFFGSGDPIGKRFTFRGDIPLTVVGVVGDIRVRGPEQTSEPQVYMSYRQFPDGQGNFYAPKDLVIRSSIPATTLIRSVRQIVRRADPEQPISNIRPLAEIVSDATAARSVQVRILLAFAAIAFALAAIGIHGLLTFAVSSRQHEIGVRLALGAQRGDIVRMVMGKAALLTVAGVIPGLLIAYAAGRSMQSLLAGIEPADLVTFGAAAALCVVMTMLGSLLPTMRAVRVDPATAFRADA